MLNAHDLTLRHETRDSVLTLRHGTGDSVVLGGSFTIVLFHAALLHRMD